MTTLPLDRLERLFKGYRDIVLVYLFGSVARGVETEMSDIDLAVLLKEVPDDLLDFYLDLMDDLSVILGNKVDLVLLNDAPPLLRHQVIKNGCVIYCRSEEERIRFESISEKIYFDLQPMYKSYNQRLFEEV